MLSSKKISRILWFFVFLTLGIYFHHYVRHSLFIVAYPWQLEYTEGFIMGYAADFFRGIPLYSSVHVPPYRVMAYVPLYFFISGLLMTFSSTAFWVGRLISLIAVFGIAFILYLTIKNVIKTSSPRLPLVGALIFITGRYVYRYSQFFRPDSLAIFLCVLALYIFIRHRNSWGVYSSLGIAIIAAFVKQNHIWALCAILWSLFAHKRKDGLHALLFVSIVTASIMLSGEVLTGGHFFEQVVYYNLFNDYKGGHAAFLIWLVFSKHSIFLFFAGLELLKAEKFSVIHRYFILVCFSTLMVGKVGSQVHYFLEFTAALSLIVPLAWDRLERLEAYKKMVFILPFLIMMQMVILNSYNKEIATAHEPTFSEQLAREEIAHLLRLNPGPILSEDAGLLVLTDHSIYIDPFLNSQLWHYDLWSEQSFIEEIERGKFKFLILEFDLFRPESYDWHQYRFTPLMLEQMRQSFTPFGRYQELYVYESRGISR